MSLDAYIHKAEPGDDALVFAFHGTGGDERQLWPLARAVWPRAALVAPRGDVSEHGALRFFRRTAEGVYDYDDLARATARWRASCAPTRPARARAGSPASAIPTAPIFSPRSPSPSPACSTNWR